MLAWEFRPFRALIIVADKPASDHQNAALVLRAEPQQRWGETMQLPVRAPRPPSRAGAHRSGQGFVAVPSADRVLWVPHTVRGVDCARASKLSGLHSGETSQQLSQKSRAIASASACLTQIAIRKKQNGTPLPRDPVFEADALVRAVSVVYDPVAVTSWSPSCRGTYRIAGFLTASRRSISPAGTAACSPVHPPWNPYRTC